MTQGIVGCIPAPVVRLFELHLEGFRDRGNLVRSASQSDKSMVEGRDKVVEDRRGVTLRIDRDKDHLHALSISGRKPLAGRSQISEDRRTSVRAIGKPEIQQDKFASQGAQGVRPSVWSREREFKGRRRIGDFICEVFVTLGLCAPAVDEKHHRN